MAQLAIRGHKTRGKEVIEILEMLGGKSYTRLAYKGEDPDRYYCINKVDKFIDALAFLLNGFQVFTLEEFLEKYPYKVGDRVKIPDCDVACRVTNMIWNGIEIKYETTNSEETFFADELQPYKEETMEEIKIDIPKGYEFAGVDDDKQQVVFTRIQPQYPKTYKECCEVLGCKANDFFTNFGYNGCEVEVSYYEDKIDDLLQSFRKLRYCRDAYWKIAGEQMGLGKPWEPDFTNDDEERYGIYTTANKVVKDFCGVGDVNVILTFPTEEMRDAFYENFKDLIEQCKELL